MKNDCILFIGTGQIGQAILSKVLERGVKKVVIHNLTQKRSEDVCKRFSKRYPETKFIMSYGNIFMPYKLKDLDNRDYYSKSAEIIDYFYKEINEERIKEATITTLIDKYRPEIVIDAINSATVLGNAYNPEYKRKEYLSNPSECSKMLMADDYTTKIINFIYSLKYSIEKYNVKRYVKVSTTGLGGMGINMPYTHGDNPKINLSSALMGKIAASGVLHQLLWNLEHIKGMNISLIIPGTFVGYDSVKSEPIETDKGLLQKRKVPKPYNIELGSEIVYNNTITDDYLEFPVVRAGENHVYSEMELKVLTAIGQMEGITKEEVANRVIDCIYGNSSHDILSALNNAMLKPTYLGREMIYDINKQFTQSNEEYGIATGNLGVKLSKQLYELFLIKKAYPKISQLRNKKIEDITKKVNKQLNDKLISEIITLGIPIVDDNNKLYIGDYTLIPTDKEDKKFTKKNIDSWTNVGWVDLRNKNIKHWIKILMMVYEDANKLKECVDMDLYRDFKKINDDYDIAEYIAYYNNLSNKGRKK